VFIVIIIFIKECFSGTSVMLVTAWTLIVRLTSGL